MLLDASRLDPDLSVGSNATGSMAADLFMEWIICQLRYFCFCSHMHINTIPNQPTAPLSSKLVILGHTVAELPHLHPQPHLSPSMHLQRSQVRRESPGKIRLTGGINPYRHRHLPLPMHQ
jgi:hypothetical protein